MSKQVMWSINDNTGKSRQTPQSNQPHWMAHWTRTSSNATAARRDNSACGNKGLHRVSRDDHITTDGDTGSRRMTSKGMGNEGMFSAQMKHGQDSDEIQARRPIINQNLDSGEAINRKGGIRLSSGGLAANENSSREYRFISEGTSKKPLEWTKTHFSAKETSSSASMPSQERFVGPSTHIVPYHDLERYKFDKGKAVVCPSISRPSVDSNNQLPDTRTKIIGQEHCHKHFSSADLIWERKIDSQSEQDTAMDDHHEPKSGQDWFQTMQKRSHMTSLLPSRCIAPDKNEQKVSLYDHYPIQQFPSCVQKTMKICTTVDAVEATPGGCPLFSQTTHSLLIKKKTDVNVSKETDMFRRFITQMNRNSSGYLDNIPPFFGQASRGVKLQPISSNSSEGQGNVGNVGIGTSKLASKNESSAETDTLNLEFPKEEIPNSGCENSSHSTKVFNFDNNLFPRIDVASSREVGRSWTNSGLPALPAVASSSEDVPTSSRTQSLEIDMLLSQAEQPEPKSNLSPKADPTARWVKRLKSSFDYQGTKRSSMAENSSHEKKGVFFRSILKKKSIASSVLTPKECHGKETSLSDGSGNSSKLDERFSQDPSKKSMLSHVWIKRWLSNGSQISQTKPEPLVVCEPQSSKPSLNDLQKKQFPSTAAIAMMGKSMSGFQSCELEKRGSFTIWNTKAF